MSTWKLAVLIWVISGVVFAGAGLAVIVSVPSLYDNALKLIPVVAAAGFAVAAVVSMVVAKKLNAPA